MKYDLKGQRTHMCLQSIWMLFILRLYSVLRPLL